MFPPVTLLSTAPKGYVFNGWKINGEMISSDSILHLSEEYPSAYYSIEAIYHNAKTVVSLIRINEVSAANDIYINEYGKKADWIELYNTTDKDYDLDGAYLSDNPENGFKFQITATDGVSTIIPAHGYKLVWCDGKEPQTQLHASFKLQNADGAYISITDANGEWTDSLYYREQPRWNTYGRFPDGGHNLAMFERPTISNTNRILTSTIVEDQNVFFPNDIVDTDLGSSDAQIASIKYYNLNGQQISNVRGSQLVIQQFIYKNGSTKTCKVLIRCR